MFRHGRGYELFPNESYFEGLYVNGITYTLKYKVSQKVLDNIYILMGKFMMASG